MPRPGKEWEKVDILAVGGSQTWGHGLDYDDTFTAVVANKFGLWSGIAASSGSGGIDSLGQILRNASLRPKVILYGFYGDHRFRNFKKGRPHLKAHGLTGPFSIHVNPKPGQPNPYYAWDEASIPKEKQVGKDAVHPFFTGKFTDLASNRPPLGFDENLVPTAISGMEFILTRMDEQADKLGAQLVVLYLPVAFIPVPLSSFYAPKQYARLAHKLGFSFIDITSEFIPYFENNNRFAYDIIIPLDGHYNAWANRIMAKKVIDEMKRLGF